MFIKFKLATLILKALHTGRLSPAISHWPLPTSAHEVFTLILFSADLFRDIT